MKDNWKVNYYDKLTPTEKVKLHRNQKISFIILGTLVIGSAIALIIDNCF